MANTTSKCSIANCLGSLAPKKMLLRGGNVMLSRPQLTYFNFAQASDAFLKYGDFREVPHLWDFYQNLIEAAAAFGTCEISARENERAKMLKVNAGDRLAMMVPHHNEKGLKFLAYAKEQLKPLRQELEKVPKIELSEKEIKASLQELAEAMVDADIKPSDADKIISAFHDNLEEMRKKGVHYLPDYLEQKVDELEKTRHQPDRGAVDNIPIWKAAMIVVIAGIWLWAHIVCNWRGRCRLRDSLPHQLMTWILRLIQEYC